MTGSPHDSENQTQEIIDIEREKKKKKRAKYLTWLLITLTSLAVVVGNTSGPLVIRYYFEKGGSRKWLSAILQTIGFPIFLPLLLFLYLKNPSPKHHINYHLFLWSSALGVVTGAVNYMYSYGLSYMPVSTAQVLLSTNVVFTAFFAYLLAKQKIGASTINAVALLAMSSVLLAFAGSTDRPEGVTKSQYAAGFAITLVGSVIYGLVIPLVQVSYQRCNVGKGTFAIIMEVQTVMSFGGTLFCLVGFLASKEFVGLKEEAEGFRGHGIAGYVIINTATALILQLFFVGLCGVTLLVNSVWTGMLIAVTIPLAQIFAVFLFGEKFKAEKGLSTVMALWGIGSYLYGEYKDHARRRYVPRGSEDSESVEGIELHPSSSRSVNGRI